MKNLTEGRIDDWLKYGDKIKQNYRDLLSDDFNRTYNFAGKYNMDDLKSSYEGIDNIASQISDERARILKDYCSKGRILFVNTDSDKRQEIWKHMLAKNRLPGMRDALLWFNAGQSLANPDILLQMADDTLGEEAANMFLMSFDKGGADLRPETLEQSYKVLKKWAYLHSNSKLCTTVAVYSEKGQELFCSNHYNRDAVYSYLEESRQLPDISNVSEKFHKTLDKKKKTEEEQRRKRREQQERLAQEESFWKSTCQTDTKSAYQNYLRKYPDGTYKKQAKQRIHEKNKRKRRILIAVAVVAAIKFFPVLYTLASDFYETHFQCHTIEVLNDPIFTTTDYEAQLAVLDSVISHTKRKKCTEDILPYYQRIDSLNFVLHELRPLFSKPKSGRSKVENYCRTKADYMDSIILVRDYLHWAEAAVPDDKEVKKYRSTFEKLVKRYKIKFS